MVKALVGIIGGSGVDQIEGLVNQEWREVSSPFGCPSDKLLFGQIGDNPIVFLPRHGRGHRLSPSSINYRANIDVLKRSGVTDVVSLSAVGSLKEKYQPGHFVLIDQFIDRTFAREKTFFEAGCVAHVNFAQPISSRLKDALYDSCKKLNIPSHKNGTYINSGNPASGASRTGSVIEQLTGTRDSYLGSGNFVSPYVGDPSSTGTFHCENNFGNGFFGTTAISSEGTNASNIGKFEYDVPANYTALTTKGLNL